MVTLMSLSKMCPLLCKKCLYNGKLVLMVLSILCSCIFTRRGSGVWPMYWLPLVHLMHSIR